MAFIGPLEDRIAVRELIESYANAVTQRDVETWASLWDEESAWRMPELGTGVSIEGKQTIVSTWVDLMARYHGPADRPWAFSFLSMPGEMNIEGDRGTVRSYSVEAYADADGRTVHLKGQYDDVVVKREGRWLFAERVWRLMPLEDHAKVAA
ncbi:MAG: nuclear transport factor 2 family protein [Sphingomonadaceae bacterium]